nr:nucleocapsid [Cytorhabdovirus sp. 'lycii']
MANTSGTKQETIEEILYKKYEKTPDPILTNLSEITYSEEGIKSRRIYRLSPDTVLSNDQLKAAGSLLVEKLRTGTDPDLAKLVFLLAMNIRDTSDSNRLIFGDLNWPNKADIDLAAMNIGWKASQTVSSTSSGQNREPFKRKTDVELEIEALKSYVEPDVTNLTPEVAESKKAASKAIHLKSAIAAAKLVEDKKEAEYNKSTAQPTVSSHDNAFASPEYWPYFAAYLMKCMIKTPANVIAGKEKLREHFIGFYPGSVAQAVDFSTDVVHRLSLRLKADQPIIATWLGHASEFEDNEPATTQNAGLIRYLVNIQFSFNGMAGYSLFKEVMNVTRWSAKDALVKLWMEPNRKVLDTINDLLSNHESVMLEGKKIKKSSIFKYARAIDPQYFLSLQPSQCLTLMYICSKILTNFTAFNDVADPLNQVALKRMGKGQAAYLDVFVDTVLHDDVDSNVVRTKIEQKAAQKFRDVKTNVEENEEMSSQELLMKQMKAKAIASLNASDSKK